MFRSVCVISGGYEVVGAFVWCEGIEAFTDDAPELIDGAGSGFAQYRLELGEGIFDGIEVGRVGRKGQERGAGRLHGILDGGAFVRRQVVEDHDIAGAQRRHEHR